jgi:hypothetical protein
VNKNISHKSLLKRFWNAVSKTLSKEQKDKVVLIKLETKCSFCGIVNPKWKNILTFDYACNDCVPRGCSCRLYLKDQRKPFSIENYAYQLDKNGEELPCEDWIKNPD